LQTLYKTPTPKLKNAEYYSLCLRHDPFKQNPVYFLEETHGWWDETSKKAQYSVTTLAPKEGLTNPHEAFEAFTKQKAQRVSDGFCHCFTPDPINNLEGRYENLC
jgi:hypothetical protein